MFSYETEHIIRKVQNRVLGSRDNVSLRLILSAPIHDAIKVYFRASVADKHGSPKRFHTEHTTDVEIMKSEIDLLLPSNFTFNKDTFTSLLTDAVHFQFNYLCRPRWTMKEFFFHNSSTVTIPELKQGFLYFSTYNYYPKVLFRYLQKKNITEVDRGEFDDIILKIDALTLGDATPDDFGKLLQPFADFIAYGREDQDASIPEHAIALFFGDKGFNHIRNYLESAVKSRGIDNFTIDELCSYLSEMPEGGIPETPISVPPLQTEPEEPAIAQDEPSEIADESVEPILEEISDKPIEEDFVDEETPEPDEQILDEVIEDSGEDTDKEEGEYVTVEEPSIDLFRKKDPEESVDEEPIVGDEEMEYPPDDEELPVVEEPFEEEPETMESPEEEFEPQEIDDDFESEIDYPTELTPEPVTEPEPEEESDITADETEQEEAEESVPTHEDDIFQPISRKPEVREEQEEISPEEYEETEDLQQEENIYDDAAEEPVTDEEIIDEEEPIEDIDEIKPKRPSSTMPPLELMIEDDERKRYVRKLFNGDSAYFNIVVQTLNKMTSWKEASLYIDEIFLMNGVDPYSTDSVHFTDKVYTRFSHKSKYK